MKVYNIINDENEEVIGTLLYYEKCHDFIVELKDNLDEWTAPLMFSGFVKKKIYTIPREYSFLWVKERVIPSGRQNIVQILKNHKMDSYDEMKLLELSGGRCSQDSLYIKKTDEIPDYILKRRCNITECSICGDNSILCFFENGEVKKVDLNELKHINKVTNVIKNRNLFESCMVGTGGYFITFNDSIDISASVIYDAGATIPLTRDDFILFTKKNLLDTSECCEMLECSRQNVSYMVSQKMLTPVKNDVKGNLYLKGEVLANRW